MIVPDLSDSLDFHVCMSACECDVQGTLECKEDNMGQHHICRCHPHFGGDDCSMCDEGYYRNAEGFCELASLCEEYGGDENCNNHGTCIQEGPKAVCECDPGFTDDGLDQCGRCSDPLMTYPNECSKRRNWVMEQEDYECETLMHVMPRVLYKATKAKSNGGLDNESQVIFQQHNGVCEWAGRYSLIQPALNKRKEQIFYNKDNTEDIDRKFRKESRHQFFVQQTSMYRLHLNTLDS